MTREVRIIGAPSDFGANRRGVDMGPSAIRYAGLGDALSKAGVDPVDAGDLTVPRAEERDPEHETPASGKAKFLRETREVCTELSDAVASTLADGAFPLTLGGDHSVAIGSLVGSARDADIGAIWFDAHGDFNTPETSPSGNVHGMPLAAAVGHGTFGDDDADWAHAERLQESNVVLVGLRDLDEREREDIRQSDMTAFSMSDVDERGMSTVVDEALDIATTGVDGVHVSFDLDFMDPNEAPGVGTPVRGGATYREAHTALEAVAERDERDGVLRSLELVEVNPILDEHNETAELAVELAASALGKRII